MGESGEVLILGGGLAGLSAGYHLGAGCRIVEKSDRVGGFCQTEVRDGFSFDKTGHWLHLRDPAMRALVDRLLGGNQVQLRRSARIYQRGRYTPYPYQVNTHELPPEVAAECVLGFIDAVVGPGGAALRAREPETFGDFIRRYLGEGFAKHFMFPYNQKLWTVHPDELLAAWCGRFVPRPTLEDVIKGSLGIVNEGGYNSTFLYPKEGGIEALPRAFLPALRGPVDVNVHPVEIDWRGKRVKLSDGRALSYAGLVSTIPLPELVRLCKDAPAAAREAAGKLQATVVTYVNVAARGEGPAHHWVYFPEPEFPFYRVGSASAIYPALAPRGTRSFYVEFSHRGTLAGADAERMALEGLLACGLLRSRDEVLFAFAREIHGAYVIYDRAYAGAKKTILEFLQGAQIESCGRYGNWEYGGMEDAMLGGKAAAARVLARLGRQGREA
ncbi:MAG TPA: FAD-dependent oxidoreductase [Myxococcales bacterium]|nr:FAD-dependent oxidoreductase [Myxococcales bacterium]